MSCGLQEMWISVDDLESWLCSEEASGLLVVNDQRSTRLRGLFDGSIRGRLDR